MTDLKQAASSGARWMTLASVVTGVSQFVRVAILARLLPASDFGLMAIVLVVLNFGQIYMDMGIANSIIYRQNTPAEHYSSLYWVNVIIGVAIFAVTACAAPLLAMLYKQPALAELTILAGLTFVIAPAGQLFQVLLQKDLHFGSLAIVDMMAALFMVLVAVVLGYRGAGIYALVLSQLAFTVFSAIGLILLGLQRWRPQFRFCLADIRPHISFGLYQMGQRTVDNFASLSDQILIGLMLGTAPLGYYALAWNLVSQPIGRINPILTRVAFPLFAKVQDDPERLGRGYLWLLWTLAIVNAPLLIGLAAAAGAAIPLFFGHVWEPSVILAQVLAFAALLMTMTNPLGSLLLAKGRADVAFLWNVVRFIAFAPAVCLGAHFGNVLGVAIAVLIVQVLLTAAMYFVVRMLVGPCAKAFLSSIAPPILLGLVMGGLVILVPRFEHVGLLGVMVTQIVTGMIVYCALLRVFEMRRTKELFAAIRGRPWKIV